MPLWKLVINGSDHSELQSPFRPLPSAFGVEVKTAVQYEIMLADIQPIEPQPDIKPFRIAFRNRGDEWWYNERRQFRKNGRGPMLMDWKCPFGVDGEPVLIDGKWFWQKVAKS